jgi:hypothetical protein
VRIPRLTQWVSIGVFAAAFLLPGCSESGDIGAVCRMVKANPDGGGGAVAILEKEIAPGRDVLSLGVVECENFVCVHDRYAPLSGNPDAELTGRCSDQCTPSESDPRSGCKGISPEATFERGPYTCRALALDPETVSIICSTDTDLCNRLFPGGTAYYCAQGAAPPKTPKDAGF